MLSANLGVYNDVSSNLPVPVTKKTSKDILLANAQYRAEHDISHFKQPFADQFRTSSLKRIASKALRWTSELVINHRNKAGTYELAAAIAYHSKMQSLYDPNIPDPTVHAIHRYLNTVVNKARSKKEKPKPIFNNCLVIASIGEPHRSGTSLSNTSQMRIALHEAAILHQYGICGPDGRLIKIAILTLYNSTLQQLR